MKCPFCDARETEVANTRKTQKDSSIWRRRKCTSCKKIFSTYEKVALDFLIIKKRNGKCVRYSSQKLFASIYDAVVNGKNHDRGEAARDAEKIVSLIEMQLLKTHKERISTKEMIEMVADILETEDPPAFYRYAAYTPYRGKRLGLS